MFETKNQIVNRQTHTKRFPFGRVIRLASLLLVSLDLVACALPPVRPENPRLAVVRFEDEVQDGGWEMRLPNRQIDGEALGFFEGLREVAPGPHRLAVDWKLVSEEEDDDSAITLLATKSGSCRLDLNMEQGRGYRLVVRALSGGSWVSDPRVVLTVRDGETSTVLGEPPCSYSGRGITPGFDLSKF